jgi:hypothetical protein
MSQFTHKTGFFGNRKVLCRHLGRPFSCLFALLSLFVPVWLWGREPGFTLKSRASFVTWLPLLRPYQSLALGLSPSLEKKDLCQRTPQSLEFYQEWKNPGPPRGPGSILSPVSQAHCDVQLRCLTPLPWRIKSPLVTRDHRMHIVYQAAFEVLSASISSMSHLSINLLIYLAVIHLIYLVMPLSGAFRILACREGNWGLGRHGNKGLCLQLLSPHLDKLRDLCFEWSQELSVYQCESVCVGMCILHLGMGNGAGAHLRGGRDTMFFLEAPWDSGTKQLRMSHLEAVCMSVVFHSINIPCGLSDAPLEWWM